MASEQYGLKISNPSYDVNTAADWQLQFNSAWPSVAIAFEKTVSVPYTHSNNSISIAHNLGFFPFAQAWLSVNGVYVYQFYTWSGIVGGSQTDTSFSVTKTNMYPRWNFRTSDVTNLDPFGNVVDGSLTAQVHVKCYNIDLTQDADFTAPKPAPAKVPYDPNFGIKIAKENKNAGSKDLRDFILHSRAQTPAVLSVLTQDKGTADPSIPGNTLIQYTNSHGVANWFFGFQYANFGTVGSPDMRYAAVPVQAQVSGAGADIFANNTFQLSVPSSPGGTMVVLRDPLFAAADQNVTY